MLQLLLGISGSGKTTRMMDEIRLRAQAGRPSILLVPEQFSSSAEAMAYRALGDEQSAFVEVVSFRTLAERILKACGGVNLRVLTDAGRAVLVRRALDGVGENLRAFARQKRSTAFCNLCAQTISELKTAGAAPEKLAQIGAEQQDTKLEDLALVYTAYETILQTTALDPEDRIALAASRADCGYLAGKVCFIDSFDGFTAPEYTMIAQLLTHGEGLWVALCCPGLAEDAYGPGVFTPVRRAAHKLIGLAQRLEVPANPPRVLAAPLRYHPASPALEQVNLILACGGEADEADIPQAFPGTLPGTSEEAGPQALAQAAPQTLTLTGAEDEWEELRCVAAEMHRLALEGVPYSRMAVICRDLAAYESVARRQLGLFGIPVFIDTVGTIEYTAPVAFLRAALALLRGGLSSRGVLALVKTGLCGYKESDVAALENYAYTWPLKAADWRAPFAQNPEGLLAAMDTAAEAQLAAAEKLRGDVVPAIEEFLRAAKGKTVREVSRRLYLLLDRFSADEHLEAAAQKLEQQGDVQRAEQARRAWDLAMELLDEMAALVGGEALSPAEYDELLLLLVRSTDFGQTPQTLECATVTSADRMRLGEPEYCFVVGVCEGEFPMQVGYSGLLTHTDRELLVAAGVEMPGSFENRVLLEEMFFYRALTAARRGLHISWPKRRGGISKAPSAALEGLRLALAPGPLAPPPEQLAATPAAAYDLLGSRYRENTTFAASLYGALAACGGEGDEDNNWDARALALLDEVDNPGNFAVKDPEVLEALLGGTLHLSATTTERWYKCRFSYFLERVLRVKPRPKAEVSPMESGTFVHHILETVLRDAGADFAGMDDKTLTARADACAEDFITQYFPVNTRRAAWQLGQIKQATGRLLCYMRDAAAASSFSIDEVELGIGTGEEGAIPPLRVQTASGREVYVSGKIDRVDVLEEGGKTWLCIVDYKTGTKKFNLDDLYFGLNMQMMMYMAALMKNGQERYPNAAPAGVLYLTGDPAPESGSRAGEGKPIYKTDGLLLRDEEVLRRLDVTQSGIFIPVRYKRDGSPYASPYLADSEKFGAVLAHVEEKLAQMADEVYGGAFTARPAVKQNQSPCDWCPYRPACRHEDGRNETVVKAPAGVFETPGAGAAPGEDGAQAGAEGGGA